MMNDLQKCILDIYKEFKKICDDEGIDYFAIGGTCIGAVRHSGFIPWDDDLDVAIPIEQFDKFLQVMGEKLPNYLKIYTGVDHKTFRYVFAKIIDCRTTFIENSELDYPESYKGVYMDIMPMSGMPADEGARIRFYKKQRIILRMNEKLRVDKKVATLKGKVALAWASFIERIFGFNFYYNKWFSIMKKYPMYESIYTGYTWWPCEKNRLKKLTFRTDWFSETIQVPFENTYMRCPEGYDEYLTKQFGNYMSYPPLSEQERHHYGIIDLNRSYLEYQKNHNLVQSYRNLNSRL